MSNVDSDNGMHYHCLDDVACLLMCQVIVVVTGVQWWLGAVKQWLLEMVVVGGGSDTVEGDGEDLVHQMRGKELGAESVKFECKVNICQIHLHTCNNSYYQCLGV